MDDFNNLNFCCSGYVLSQTHRAGRDAPDKVCLLGGKGGGGEGWVPGRGHASSGPPPPPGVPKNQKEKRPETIAPVHQAHRGPSVGGERYTRNKFPNWLQCRPLKVPVISDIRGTLRTTILKMEPPNTYESKSRIQVKLGYVSGSVNLWVTRLVRNRNGTYDTGSNIIRSRRVRKQGRFSACQVPALKNQQLVMLCLRWRASLLRVQLLLLCGGSYVGLKKTVAGLGRDQLRRWGVWSRVHGSRES